MDSHLESENFSLRRQLELLLCEARANEEKLRRFDQLEQQLIAAGSLGELIRLLLAEYKLAFGVEHVTLMLVDEDYEVSRTLDAATGGEPLPPQLTLVQSSGTLRQLYGDCPRPRLEAFEAFRHAGLFDAPPGGVASVALLPLSRQGRLIGSMHFGSADSGRYGAGRATDFLERLASIIGICLDGALARERLKQLGLTDALTGVQNRRHFEHRITVEISQATRYRHALVCMLLDIDRFKRINDSHGHPTGDEVLRSVARVVQRQLRAGDTVARYGGEEFVILLPRAAHRHAQEIAERIRKSVADMPLRTASGQPFRATVSIGLAMLPAGNAPAAAQDLAADLVGRADKALYRAKNSGRNRVVSDVGQPLSPLRRISRSRIWRLAREVLHGLPVRSPGSKGMLSLAKMLKQTSLRAAGR